jgi:putative inorganic carbon (HCO3(-)) transporter
VDVLKGIKIKILPLFGKGIALFLFALIGYFLFYFAVFSKNSFTFLGFILIILFCFFFLEYGIYIFILTLPLMSQVPKLLNLPLFSPSELLFLGLLMVCLLKVIFNKKKIVLFECPLDLPVIIFSFVVISSFLSTFITHYPLDFFYKEKVLSVLKRMLFIRNPYDYSYIFTSAFTILEGILLYFLVRNFIRKEKLLNRIYFLLILGWGIVIILGFIQYFGGVLGNERWPTRMFSLFDNPNLFGGYLILMFPLVIFKAINKPPLKSMLLSIFAIFSVISIILSRSKTSWIAFALLLVFIGIFFFVSYARKEGFKSSVKILNWKWICVFVIGLVIIFGSFYIYLKKGKVLEMLSEDLKTYIPNKQESSLHIRLQLWKHAIQIVEDFPLFGVGIGRFNFALPKYCPYENIWCNRDHFHPHNYFLLISGELGLIGLYAFLWILGVIFIEGLQIIRGKQDFSKLGIWFGIIGFILTFFGDGYLWNIEMQLMFWLFIGLLFVDEEGNEMTQTRPRSSNKRLLIGLSLILLLTIPFQIYQRSRISFLPAKSIGLYPEEFKDQVREYQWGEKVVMIPLEVKGKWINIPIRFGNPDIKKHPVKAKIFINRRIIDYLDFKDNDWHTPQYPIQEMKGSEIFIKIEASRTWNPYLMGVRHETRDLGPALGKIFWSS